MLFILKLIIIFVAIASFLGCIALMLYVINEIVDIIKGIAKK